MRITESLGATHGRANICRRHETIRGFTMLEILVGVAIVCLLAALLFAASGRVLEGLKQVKCLSNLRQISSALLLRAGDEENKIVSFSGGANATTIWGYRLVADGYIPRTAAEKILRCPAAADFDKPDGGVAGTPWYWYTYGMNQTADVGEFSNTTTSSGQSRVFTIRLSTLAGKKDKGILLADSFEGRLEDGRFRESFRISPAYVRSGVELRHDAKANVAFFDGHVATLKREDLKELAVEHIEDAVGN